MALIAASRAGPARLRAGGAWLRRDRDAANFGEGITTKKSGGEASRRPTRTTLRLQLALELEPRSDTNGERALVAAREAQRTPANGDGEPTPTRVLLEWI